MSTNTMIFITMLVRISLAAICVVGAVKISIANQDGWGWLIFAALVFGCVTINRQPPEDEQQQHNM